MNADYDYIVELTSQNKIEAEKFFQKLKNSRKNMIMTVAVGAIVPPFLGPYLIAFVNNILGDAAKIFFAIFIGFHVVAIPFVIKGIIRKRRQKQQTYEILKSDMRALEGIKDYLNKQNLENTSESIYLNQLRESADVIIENNKIIKTFNE
ncbi:MAG: hypothetical protein FH761_14810 [Firmicutes bacterium]|nr:hypothetical protein [Bacillota bacterium]